MVSHGFFPGRCYYWVVFMTILELILGFAQAGAWLGTMVLTLVCGQAYVTALFVLETCRYLHRSQTTTSTITNDNHQPSQPPQHLLPTDATNTPLHHQDTTNTCPILVDDNEEEERNDTNGSSTHAPSTVPLTDDHDNNIDESPSHYELSTLTKLVLGRTAGWFFTATLACDLYAIAWAFCSVFGQAMAQEFPLRSDDNDATLDDYQIYILCFMVVAIPLSCTNLLDQLILQLAFLATRMVMVTVMIVTLMHAHANPQQTLFAIPNDGDDNDDIIEGRPTQSHESLGWEWSHLLTVVELAVFSTAFQFCVPHILYLTTTTKTTTTGTTESSPSPTQEETTPNGAMPLPIESVSGSSNVAEPRSLIDEGQPEAESSSSSSDSTQFTFPRGTLVAAVLFIWGSNLTLSWLQSTYFGPDYTESSSNLNWADYQGTVRVRTASSSPVGNFVVLFAALDGLAVFPLLALSLGDILHHAFCVTPPNHVASNNNINSVTQPPSTNDLSDEEHPRTQQQEERGLVHRVWDCLASFVFQRPRIRFRLLASIPPAVAALLVRDLPTLASLGVIFTMLSYTAAPSLLYLAVQRQKQKLKESQQTTATHSKGDVGLQNPSSDLLLDKNDPLEPANPNDSGWFDGTIILTTIAWTLLVTVAVLIVAILVQFSMDRRNE